MFRPSEFMNMILFIILLGGHAFGEWVPVSSPVHRGSSARLVADDGRTVRIRFRLEGYERETVWIEGSEYVRIAVPGMAPSLRRGEPELPIWTESVIINDRGSVSARIVSERWEEIPTEPVIPSKGNLPRSVNPVEVPYEFDNVYTETGWFPHESMSITEPFILRDFRGVTVALRPIRYDPDNGMLQICREMEVEVSVSPESGMNEKERPRSAISREFLSLYGGLFLNGELRDHEISEHAGRMLIIAADQFYEGMSDLVDWKIRKGIETEIVPYSAIGGSGATAVKNFIQNEYDDDGVTFILLVGDKEHIPTLNFAGGEADPMYTLLEGGDVYPDAFLSRFSVRNAADVETMVERSIGYEKNPTAVAGWYHKATGIASAEGGPPDFQWMNGFRDKLLNYTYTQMDQIYDPGASSSQVATALNNGRGLVLYMGHGSTGAWSTSGFSTSNVNALVNDWQLPVISSVACDNGDFGVTTCFAEAWLKATHNGHPTGAIAIYASSIGQSWVPPQYGQQGFVDSLVNDRYNTIGGTLYMGSVAMLEHYSGGYDAQEIFNTWHIFGDCSVQMRTDIPSELMANYPASVPVGAQSYHVSVPLFSDALVALSDDDGLIGSGYTDENGDVDVSLGDQIDTPGTMILTITGYNAEPVEDEIYIIAPDGPYVIYTDNAILGDGMADIGETVSLDITVENVGTETAPAVEGSLQTTENAISFNADVQDFGDIPAGTTAVSSSPYQFTVGNVSDGTMVPFDIVITAGDSLWWGGFTIMIHAPDLDYAGWQLDDASGNGNGRADPGETADLQIAVSNSGSGTALDATITVDDADPYITIAEPHTISMGNIGSGEEVVSPSFTVTFDPSTPEAYSAQIPLSFESNNGAYTTSSTLTLMVGQGALLLVDGDAESTEGRIVAALDALGMTYGRWNTYETGMGIIPVDTLLAYQTILWAAGDQSTSSVIPQNRTHLAAYLEQGGSLLLSAENYLTFYGTDSFTTSYLHVSSYQINITAPAVSGVTGDPIGDDVTVTLNYPSGLESMPDKVVPDGAATTVFRVQGSSNPVAIRYPATGAGQYRVLFFGAPLEAFPETGVNPSNIQTVLNRSLAWLSGTGDFSPPTTPMDVMLSSDGTLSWSASMDNVGVDHYAVYRRTSAFFDIQSISPFRTVTETSTQFPGSVGDPDTNFYFTVTAIDAMGNESSPSGIVGGFDYAIQQ